MAEKLDTHHAAEAYRDRLKSAHRAVKKLYHDANNPLAILVGNVQLALEIASSMQLGDEIMEPLQDIDRAVQRLTKHMDRLAEIGQDLEEPVG